MKIWLLGGTGEGKELCRLFSNAGAKIIATVASGYGAQLIKGLANIEVREGKLHMGQMEELLKEGICCVVDATHPYAVLVSQNAKNACLNMGVPYIRIGREKSEIEGAIEFECAAKAAEYLSDKKGNIFLTTGANTSSVYAAVSDYKSRVFIRVLPDSDSIIKCEQAGYNSDNIIAMKGPFGYEMNLLLLKLTNAKFIVTKDGGKAGQVLEKVKAAKELGVEIILIKRPEADGGVSANEAFEWAMEHYKTKEVKFSRFPIFIDINEKNAVLIGGGAVAIRRAEILKSFGAKVYIIAPEIKGEIDGIIHIKRPYKEGDFKGAAIAVAASDDRAVNARAANEALRQQIPISCADDPFLSSFHFPAIIKNDIACAGMITGDPSRTKRLAQGMRKALDALAQDERQLTE